EHLLTQWIDAIEGDDVPRERQPGARIDDRLNGPVRDPGLREVAGALERGRQIGARGRGWPRIVGVFLRGEEVELPGSPLPPAVEQPGDHHGPADGVARNVDAIERLGQVRRLVEVVVRIEPVAPAVVPPRALQSARARFGDHADEAAAVPAILGRVTVGDDLYFADGVHVQVDEAGAAAAFIDDVHAVDAQVLIDGRRTVDGDRRRRPPLREVAIQIGVLDAGQDREEAVHVAALHLNVRQIVDRDGAPARAVRQLHRGDLGGDGDGLGDRAELQRQSAEIPYFGRQEIDVTDGQGAEAGELDADHVSARIQRGHSKQPDFI